MQAAKGSPFEEGLQAVQSRAEQQVALLADAIKAAIQDEQAARQKRHTFTLEAVSDMGMQLPLTLAWPPPTAKTLQHCPCCAYLAVNIPPKDADNSCYTHV